VTLAGVSADVLSNRSRRLGTADETRSKDEEEEPTAGLS